MTEFGALARVRLEFQGDVVGYPLPDHAHAVLCGWLDGSDGHRELRKPFTLRRLSTDNGTITMEVTTLHAQALADLQRAVNTADQVRLGSSHVAITRAEAVEIADWTDLLDGAGASGTVGFHFEQPVRFRSGRYYTVMPTPTLVFGHLRAVWSDWCPEHLRPHLDLSQVPIFVEELRGSTSSTIARGRTITGFTGDVTFNLAAADERDRRVLHALAALAPFSGVGANTTVGCGATTLHATTRTTRQSGRRPQRKVTPR
jgi:CRISPR-associated endoribonuclease Cas6